MRLQTLPNQWLMLSDVMKDDKIIEFFKKYNDSYVSGEELSREFKVSRTAIWKHIEKLREEGYDIIASPHLGYRLMSLPDRLTEVELKWQLDSSVIGNKIYAYRQLDSTNDVAYRLAMSGEKEGAVVISEYQTKGRGRLGRKWISPKNKGAYFSLILRPDILAKDVSTITAFVSLGVTKAIRDATGLPATIKWPNDIFIKRKKVSGILIESSAESDKVNFIVAGIGININTEKDMLPKEATSLAIERKKEILRVDFVKSVLKTLDIYYRIFRNGGISEIMEEYKNFLGILDTRVQINYHNKLISGYAVDVDSDGALVLRLDTGLQVKILAGDVLMLR